MHWFSVTPLVWLASWPNVCWHPTSCDPVDSLDSKHWQASRRLAIRPWGLISRVAPNPSWLLPDIRSIRPGKVDMRNVENVRGQKQHCRKSLSHSSLIFNQSSWHEMEWMRLQDDAWLTLTVPPRFISQRITVRLWRPLSSHVLFTSKSHQEASIRMTMILLNAPLLNPLHWNRK